MSEISSRYLTMARTAVPWAKTKTRWPFCSKTISTSVVVKYECKVELYSYEWLSEKQWVGDLNGLGLCYWRGRCYQRVVVGSLVLRTLLERDLVPWFPVQWRQTKRALLCTRRPSDTQWLVLTSCPQTAKENEVSSHVMRQLLVASKFRSTDCETRLIRKKFFRGSSPIISAFLTSHLTILN